MTEPQHRYDLAKLVPAYMDMANRADYRPAAPSDGFGNITTGYDAEQQLMEEAVKWATKMSKATDDTTIHIGIPNFEELDAYCLFVEAARLCCSGGGYKWALKVAKLAIERLEA